MALMFNFYKGEVAQIDQWTILAPRTCARLIGSLSNDDGDVNRDGKKSNWFRLETDNYSARASRFFVHFFVVAVRYTK